MCLLIWILGQPGKPGSPSYEYGKPTPQSPYAGSVYPGRPGNIKVKKLPKIFILLKKTFF